MRGGFGERGELYFEVELIAFDGTVLPIEALLDTGFTGWIALNNQDASSLGWVAVDELPMNTARGIASFTTYSQRVRLAGEEFEVEVLGGDNVPEVLIGLAWLQSRRLVVDFPANLLVLGV